MIGVTLLVCLTVLAIAYRAELLLDRWLALREAPAPRQEAVSLPRDLYNVAQSYHEEWAREQAMQAMREMYGESGSWDIVRIRYGLAEKGE